MSIYSGEIKCATQKCTNHAYYESSSGGIYLCGVHSRKDAHRRVLPKNPNAAELRHNQLQEYAKQAFIAQASLAPQRGFLATRSLRMMKPLPIKSGYFAVLPNAKAHSYGCPDLVWACQSLSPMRLGPVRHTQPGLPPSQNIENFHQFNKVFESEVDRNLDPPGVLPIWYERRLMGYADKIPHRHKLGNSKAEHLKNSGAGKGANANMCVFSVFVDPEGRERRYSYVESRVFYCTFYEELATKTEDFQRLHRELLAGASLCLMGYDARDHEGDLSDELLMQWYLDPTRPFGHEMVLLALLHTWPRREALPWNRWKAEHLNFPIVASSS